MRTLTVGQFMTRDPHTVALDASLSDAHRVMREHHIRHLPVVESRRLVGIVSQRDLYLIETFKDVETDEVTVSEAMTPDVFVVDEYTPAHEVARQMADSRIGCAVVMSGSALTGIFTVTDALRAFCAFMTSALVRDHTSP